MRNTSSRMEFARLYNAVPGNARYAWSWVNHLQKFVIFGAWDDPNDEGYQIILRNDWWAHPINRRKDGVPKRQPAFSHAKTHADLIWKDGYRLFVFRQYAGEKRPGGAATVKRFDRNIFEKQLKIVDQNYYAMEQNGEPVNPNEVVKKPIERFVISEGTVTETFRSVRHLERSRTARDLCIEHHGYRCQACKFDFGEGYGALGKGFIHVHHRFPIATNIGVRFTNPINDLVPLCPNCHAMVHRGTGRMHNPLAIEDLINVLKKEGRVVG